MAHDMRFFMKKSNEDEIIKVKGLERFTDDEGNIIPFEIKKLSRAERRKINKAYTSRKIAIQLHVRANASSPLRPYMNCAILYCI